MAANKRQDKVKDRPIRVLDLTLPDHSRDDSTILDLNPILREIKIFSTLTGKVTPVFDGCMHTSLGPYLVEYVVRMYWFHTPHQLEPNIGKRKEQAARDAGLLKNKKGIEDLSPDADYKTWPSQKQINFEVGTTAYRWAKNFIEYQRHIPFRMFSVYERLCEKLEKYADEIDLSKSASKDHDPVDQLMGIAEFFKESATAMQNLQERMFFVQYKLDELGSALPKQEEESTSLADDAVAGNQSEELEDTLYGDEFDV